MSLLNKSWALSALFALVRQKGGSHPIVLQAITLLPQLLYVLELTYFYLSTYLIYVLQRTVGSTSWMASPSYPEREGYACGSDLFDIFLPFCSVSLGRTCLVTQTDCARSCGRYLADI